MKLHCWGKKLPTNDQGSLDNINFNVQKYTVNSDHIIFKLPAGKYALKIENLLASQDTRCANFTLKEQVTLAKEKKNKAKLWLRAMKITVMRAMKQSLASKYTPKSRYADSMKEILRTWSSVTWKSYNYLNPLKSLSPAKGHFCLPDFMWLWSKDTCSAWWGKRDARVKDSCVLCKLTNGSIGSGKQPVKSTKGLADNFTYCSF